MTLKNINRALFLPSIFALSFYSHAECARSVALSVGTLGAQLNQVDPDMPGEYLPETMDLDYKYKYVESTLASKVHSLELNTNHSNGRVRKCVYISEQLPELQVVLKQSGRRAVELNVISLLEKNVQDDEFHVYENQVVLKQKLSRSRTLSQGESSFEGTLRSRNHYDYSCGFIDCTYSNDDYRDLAKANISITWN